jgi:predicted acylesterase/phospholipase RssA
MKSKLNCYLFACFLTSTIVVTGCKDPIIQTDRGGITGLLEPGDLNNEMTKSIASANQIELEKYADEWKYNKDGHTNGPPHLGLALSGGGMRSANFCIGVLHGLEQLNVLSNVDVISSVSGGGYAASWFYIQSISNNFDQTALFDDEGKYQQYLANHGEMMSHEPASPPEYRWMEYLLTEVPFTLCSIPVNAFANGLFGWHVNVSPVRYMYQNGIDRIYDMIPEDHGIGKRSDFDLLHLSTGQRNTKYASMTDLSRASYVNPPIRIKFSQLGTNIVGRLPFPIVNTTAFIESSSDYSDHWLRNRVFEFTPNHFGSDYYGYQTNFPSDMDYNKAIAISGAAVDTTSISPGATASWVESALNVNWGYWIHNSNQSYPIYYQKMWMFPIYPTLGHYQRDIYGTDIYLNDGGYSDNLAAYSLVRRYCQSIIIVDAGYDPHYTFADYKVMRNALRDEKGVTFSVPDIDKFVLNTNYFGTNSWDNPVMTGTISYFPWPKVNQYQLTNNSTINIIYIKLSLDLDSNSLLKYPKNIQIYYEAHKNDTMWNLGKWFESSSFPHRSTKDLSYTLDEIKAFQDLGYLFVTKNPNIFNPYSHAN